jgi:hypothetical protein
MSSQTLLYLVTGVAVLVGLGEAAQNMQERGSSGQPYPGTGRG